FLKPGGSGGLISSTHSQYCSTSLPVCGRIFLACSPQAGHSSAISGCVCSIFAWHLSHTHLCWHGKNTCVLGRVWQLRHDCSPARFLYGACCWYACTRPR